MPALLLAELLDDKNESPKEPNKVALAAWIRERENKTNFMTVQLMKSLNDKFFEYVKYSIVL